MIRQSINRTSFDVALGNRGARDDRGQCRRVLRKP